MLNTFHGFGGPFIYFYEVGLVDRDLTKFQDSGFFHARNTACKTKSHSDLLPRHFNSDLQELSC